MDTQTKMKGVWVRAKNGALYKNPRRVVPGGFVSFPEMDDGARALAGFDGIVHVWCYDAEQRGATAMSVLDAAVGLGAWKIVDTLGRQDAVEVPGPSRKTSDPQPPASTLPALGLSFRLLAPIPEPHYHDGQVRYRGRVGRDIVIDPEDGQ